MNIFMIYIRDDNFYQLLPERMCRTMPDNGRAKVMALPPLGIQTLAPIVRQQGHQVRLFDTCHPQMKAEHIVEAVKEEKPDVIALSMLSTTTYLTAKSITKMFKAEAPDTPIILGGVFPSMNATHILADCDHLDYVGVGEGEELLPDFLDHLDDPGAVDGLVWRNGTEIVKNTPRPLLQDLDRYPYADRTSLPIDYIESLPLHDPLVLSMDKFCTMQTSRGCPFKCVYCDIPDYSGRRWRHRSPEHVLGEMQELYDQGYRAIYLTDDHFLLKRERIKAICYGILERKLDFKWSCEGRVDSNAIDQMALMHKAHCTALMFGVEAGTQKTLDRLGKDQTLEQVENAISEAKKHGIERTHGFFLIGAPGETEEEIMESFRFAARLKLDTFNFGRLCAYRGTPLWKEYVERGIIDDERDWYKWFKCSDIDATVLPSEELNRIRKKGYALLFFRRIISQPIRTARFIRLIGKNMTWSDLIKLIRSPFVKQKLHREPELPVKMVELGLKEPERAKVTSAS